MKQLTKPFFVFVLLSLTTGSCKDDDDSPETTNFTQYFDCKINHEVFEPASIPFSCSPLAWDYYPEQYMSTPAGYALLKGINCQSFESLTIRIWGLKHQTGTLNFLEPQFADSVSPYYRLVDTINGNVLLLENLVSGQMTINKFTPRESGSSPLGEIQGTFDFTITDSLGLDTLKITDGRFRFTVPQIF